MNLYALLIGINKYHISPLRQCVNDVNKFEIYLKNLEAEKIYDTISIQKLTDKTATKSNIVKNINTVLNKAKNKDTVFLYYSGHGALEESSGRFSDAHSGTIECLVCYDNEGENENNFLLADKELRYLFSKFKNDPHIITVFDCCHSGDMVRAFNPQKDNGSRQRRLNGIFPSRKYSDFIFSQEIDEDQIKSQKLASLIPYKNSVNISACLASESSWEDAKGGVFTRYLLQLLKTKNNKINYLDITKWAKISLKGITNKKQTPTISVQGQGKNNHYSAWLNLYPKQTQIDQGEIFFNNKNGWYYNKGFLFGIKEGSEITVNVNKHTTFTAKIKEVTLEDSLIQDPMEHGVLLDYKKSYPVSSETIYESLGIFISNLDHDKYAENDVKLIVEDIPNINLCSADQASFFVTIFNQTVYINLPNEQYRPLAVQIDLLDTQLDQVKKMLSHQLNTLIKWNYYCTLENPDGGFSKTPLKVEIRLEKDQQWLDITNTESNLTTLTDQLTRNDEFYQKYQIKVSNTSKETIFVTTLLLGSDLAISSDPFDHKTKRLRPKESIMFYEHTSSAYAGWSFDTYKEIYNWKHDWLHYKFIVNNKEDITSSIPNMTQIGVQPPITHLGNLMGHGAISDFLPEKTKWGVYTSTLNLINPSYNIVSKKLIDHWDWYCNHEILAPFINSLYTEKKQNGFAIETKMNTANVLGDKDINSKNLSGFTIDIANYLDDKRRYRKFKKSKRLLPELPVIVAEGDSWFLFPFLVKDTLDYVMEKYPLRSIAAAGDELQNYRTSRQLLKEIEKERPKYVLISGGGNDIIGPEIVNILKKGMPSGLTPSAYLNDFYDTKTKDIEATYNYFFNRIHEFDFVEQVFVHGYDYVRADHNVKTIKKGWVNKYLIQKGITLQEDRTNVIRYLIDKFNDLLKEVTHKHKNATYIDMRHLVKKDEWYDEIHPNDVGFAKVGRKFIEAINQLEYVYHENM
ncbi:caspase family protein [Aquimarina algiphila]|uniref:caspase family protein n=1 Tax=Aquimarina algiphila TaxID=2047982 RepID=UPI00248FF607|nr:caspase family protein [Aquimarina algiphila]